MKLTFTDTEIKTIITLYTKDGLNTTEIGVKLGISKTPINRILKDNGVLRKGKSNGVKIILTPEQGSLIKEMYLREYMSCDERVGASSPYVTSGIPWIQPIPEKEGAPVAPVNRIGKHTIPVVSAERANKDKYWLVSETPSRLIDRKSTRLNSSHEIPSRMPSSA